MGMPFRYRVARDRNREGYLSVHKQKEQLVCVLGFFFNVIQEYKSTFFGFCHEVVHICMFFTALLIKT